jgi:hypothetical protein
LVALYAVLNSRSGNRLVDRIERAIGFKPPDRYYQCDLEIRSLQDSIKSFEQFYGHLPDIPTNLSNEVGNAPLIEVLAFPRNGVTGHAQNPKNIRFMAIATNSIVKGNFVDPWKHPYHIVFESNDSGKVLVGSAYVQTRVAIWSDGPNQINEFGKGDDFCNWK